MFQLIVQSPDLENFSVILAKSTLQSYSVICGLWPAQGGLPTTVEIGALYAYASNFQGQLQSCITISSALQSSPLSKGNVYRFDGARFVEQGPAPQDFDYGLVNGSQNPLSCGLCQDFNVNGVPATSPVSVQLLLPANASFFQIDERFWLGVGQILGPGNPQPGLLLSTSLLQPSPVSDKSLGACDLVLGPFVCVDFSENSSWVASYQPASDSFQVQPANNPSSR